MSWEETRVERLAQHLAKTFYGSPVPVRRLVGRRRARRRRRAGAGHAGPAEGARSDPRRRTGKGFYLLKDFPTAREAGPRSCGACATSTAALKDRGRHVLIVSPRLSIPEDAQEGDLRRRVRAARRRRDHADPRRAPAPAPRPDRIDDAADAPAGARDARPDGGRDRAPVSKVFAAAQDVRRGRLPRGPRREGADVAEGGRARVRAARASRSTTSAATRS